VASRFSKNLYTPSVSIFRLPSAIDLVHLPHPYFHNTATTTSTTAAVATATATTDDDDNNSNKCVYNKKINQMKCLSDSSP
jgi:hypothetical protein